MKRCPQCNRVEADDKLAFCRSDGAEFISDSGSFGGNAATTNLASGPVSSEIETSLLPHKSTTPEINRNTGPTTALPVLQAQGTTRDLTKPNRRGFVFATIGIALIVIGAIVYVLLVEKSNDRNPINRCDAVCKREWQCRC
jgi:hypothetical protein